MLISHKPLLISFTFSKHFTDHLTVLRISMLRSPRRQKRDIVRYVENEQNKQPYVGNVYI